LEFAFEVKSRSFQYDVPRIQYENVAHEDTELTIYFSSAPIPPAENDREPWDLDRRKRILCSNIFVLEKRFSAFV